MTDQNQAPADGQDLQQTIISELGLGDLPADKQEQLLIKMTEVVLKRIFVETMEKLNDEDQKQYEKLIDENATPEQLEGFLKEKIAGYDEMVQKIVADFKAEMVKEAQ